MTGGGKWISLGQSSSPKEKRWVSLEGQQMSVPSLQQGHSAPGLPTASQGKPGGLAELKPEGLRSRQDSGGERCHLGQGRRMTEQNSNYGHLHEIKCEGGNRPEQKVHSCQTWRLLTTTPVLERLRGRRIVIGLRPACQIPSPPVTKH